SRSAEPRVVPGDRPRSVALGFPSVLLLGSGAASLVYQVLWVKQLGLIVGVDVYAVTIAVSAFFAGLAIGAFVLGRRADRFARPLLLYAAIEVAIAVTAVAVTVAFAHTAALFASAERIVGTFAWLIPFVLVGTPALLMGGTLPVMARALQPQQLRVGDV